MNLYFIALLSLTGFYAFNYFQIINMEGWEMFDKYATENEKEMKENLADQMLEANGNSDQQEVERLGMEYKNIYIVKIPNEDIGIAINDRIKRAAN